LPEETEKLFPQEAICEIYFNEEWQDVKPGTYKEYSTTYGLFTSYVDATDNKIVFVVDRIVQGWKLDPDLVVLEPENLETQKELTK
jgi:hypothetical protein